MLFVLLPMSTYDASLEVNAVTVDGPSVSGWSSDEEVFEVFDQFKVDGHLNSMHLFSRKTVHFELESI